MLLNKINLIFFLPNFSEGGAGRSIMKICNNLNSNLFKITIISLGKCYYKRYFKKNTKFYEIKEKKTFISYIKILNILKKNFLRNNSIFISNINYSNVLACIFIKILANYRLVLVERTPLKELHTYYSFSEFIKKKIIYIFMKIFYRFSDLVIVNSTLTYKNFKSKIKCKVYKIFSPSIDKVKKGNIKKNLKNIKIISIGRISNEKRFDILIDTISFLRNYNANLEICGNGSNKILEKLRQQIKEKSLNRRIKLSSFNNNYYRKFKKYNIFMNTSDFEGFPNSVVEAYNNNLHIICSNSYGGVHDVLLKGKLGKILKTNDPKKISLEIVDYIKNINFYIKNSKLKKKILNEFTASRVANKYSNVFKKIIS